MGVLDAATSTKLHLIGELIMSVPFLHASLKLLTEVTVAVALCSIKTKANSSIDLTTVRVLASLPHEQPQDNPRAEIGLA